MGLDFTTLARVRAILSFEDEDQTKDAELQRLITAVSDDMERELRRFSLVGEHVETLPFWNGDRSVTLGGTPVLDTPAPVVLASAKRDYTGSNFSTLVRGEDFILENETGLVRILSELRGTYDPYSGQSRAPTYLKITYTGGLALTTAALMAAHPALAAAAELQVKYAWQRQKSPGGNLVIGPNSTNFEQPMNWLPTVRRTLDYMKRRSVM
jgi:hypothetical protein